MKEIRTEIEINAGAERVWRMLTDFAAYPEWNPCIVEISGEAREGARLKATLRPPGTRGWTFRPVILRVDRPRELRWLGRLGLRHIFDGEHVFTIEPITEKRVRFVQREIFSGLLVPFLAHMLDDKTLRGFEEMNRWLKKRAEEPDTSMERDGRIKDEREQEETALMNDQNSRDVCPRCGAGRLRGFDELSEEEREVVRRLPASADYASGQRQTMHRWCTKCWYEATAPDSTNA